MIIQLLGIIGSLLFAVCGIPPAYQTVKAGRVVGAMISTSWMIFLGGIAMYSYLLLTYGFDWILSLNYISTIISWGILVWYHYFPRDVFAKMRKMVKEMKPRDFDDSGIDIRECLATDDISHTIREGRDG